MEFIEASKSNCTKTEKIHYFVFLDDSDKKQIGIGIASEYTDGSSSVEIFHSTSKHSFGGYIESVDMQNVLSVSIAPFSLPDKEYALQTFIKADYKTPIKRGAYYVLSAHWGFDVDSGEGGVSYHVSLGYLDTDSDPELPEIFPYPLTFEGFSEVCSDGDDPIVQYKKFEWPDY